MKNAFTLLEMAMVLVIIGLLVGSIVIGQSLVRSAQLQSVVTEYDFYLKSIKEFQDKYLALPGDMNNATSIWTTAATANGDGSGTIGTSDTLGNPSDLPAPTGGINGISTSGEWFIAWQHLGLAGFIPGNYPGTGSTTAIIGTNVPSSKLTPAGWTILYYLNTSGNAGLWSDQYGHIFAFGAKGTSAINSNYITNRGVLTPSEAYDIDSKMDDGMPGTGKIRSWNNVASCSSSASQTTQAYVSNKAAGQACSLVFLLGF